MKIRTLEPVKSGHKYSGPKGMFRRSADRKKWEKIIWGLCNGKPPKYDRKVTIRVTAMRTRILFDEDNLAAGCKPIYDAIVKLGIIKDDSPKYCHMDPRQEKCRAMNAQTVVEIL